MPTVFPTIAATSFAIQDREALSSVRSRSANAGVSAANPALPRGVTSRSAGPAVISQQDGRALLSTSVAAGRSILAGLEAIRDSLGLAAETSLTQPNAATVDRDGAQFSNIDIESQAAAVRTLINQVASAATVGGVNLLTSNARAIEIETGEFGGSLRIDGQDLDADGLGFGFGPLSADDPSGSQVSVVSVTDVTRAIGQVRERLDTLEFLQGALDASTASVQSFGQLLSTGPTDSLPRGSFVNLSA